MDSLPNSVSTKELNELDHETKITSLPPTPNKSTAFTVDFDDMNNNMLKSNTKKKLDIRDSIKKFVPPKLEKLIKSRVKDEKVKQKNSEEKFDYLVDKGNNPNLSDGAYFLIQKMLFSEPDSQQDINFDNKTKNMTNKNQETKEFYSDSKALSSLRLKNYNSNNSLKSPTTIEMDSGVCADELDLEDDFNKNKNDDDNNSNEDALSETGTYTVDLDKTDPIAEEARKRINEIFGESSRPKKNNQIDCGLSSSSSSKSKHSFKISNVKKDMYIRPGSNRTRHNSEKSNASLKVRPNKNQELSKFCSSNEKINFKDKRVSCSTNKKDFSKTSLTKKSQLNQNINLINQNNTFVFNCNNEPNSLLNRARANSMTKSFTKLPNKNELVDNQYEEKCSVKSEDISTGDSTDLSSIGSEKYKSDTCQTSNLRFNRAFALRRARLGIDTPPIISNKTAVNRNSTSSRNQSSLSNTNKPASRSSSQCSTSAYFDRSDGGRFSLRAPRIASKTTTSLSNKVSNKGSNLNSNESSNLLKAISKTSSLIKKNRISSVEKLNSDLKNSNIKTNETQYKSNNHVRANSFGGSKSNENIVSKPRLSSAASTSSNTISNASTSEDLSVLSDTINVKNLKHLSPHQLGRRIYSTKPYYIAQTNSFRVKLEENSNQSLNTSKNDLNQSNKFAQQLHENENNSLPYLNNEKKNSKFGNLNIFNQSTSNSKSLSALDYLVLSAVHQLSFKLRCKLRSILDAEKSKYPIDNENRILIEELLPQVSVSEFRNSDTSEKTISRDLSNVLKNLKRIEQSLEVINLLLESNSGFMDKSVNDSVNELVRGMNNEFNF